MIRHFVRSLVALMACAPLTAGAAIQYFMGTPGQVFMVGLAADTKPAAGNASVNGAVFVEADTAKVFRREAGVWVEKPNLTYQPLATDLTRLVDNCALDNDSTPIPDSCVGDGVDGGGAPADADYLVGTTNGSLSAEIVVGTSPGGELGNTWASPTLDDSLTVDAWAVTNATGTTAAGNDNDTSLATTAFVQSEIDDGDNLSDNCAIENDSTPIPDSCVGDGSDGGGGFTSFNADGDNNSPQAITDGNELLIAGGTNGVDTSAGATDTVTINLDLSESPSGGELGGNLDAPTLDDGVTVDAWALGASTATTAAANDSDTSLATTAFVQAEIDDVDNLSDNCIIANSATPVPDSCVGNGTDDGAATTIDFLVGTATGGLSAEIVAGTSPGGELGGTWASPTIDDTITVDAWTMGASFATSAAANDNDTSLATTAFVQTELDDVDLLSDNCVLENDATPIPDSCVGDGSDAGGGGGAPDSADYLVGTANGSLSAEIVVGTSPGGELGGTWASPTLDDSITVDTWTLGSATVGSTASANDSDTSLATTAFVQGEIDDGDNLTDNCALEADATPIPTTCLNTGLAPTASPTFTGTVTLPGTTDIGAGSATASSWPNFTSGTVLTTAEDGALEVGADALYFTTDAGNRGYIPVRNVIRANAARNLPNDTNENAIFNSPANGRFTLETGTYIFKALIGVTAMSATSGNALIDILGAGTATVNDWLWSAVGKDGTLIGVAAVQGVMPVIQSTPASMFTAATTTELWAVMDGTFTVTVAGTLIPSIDLVTASAAVVAIGSYFMCERIGDASVVSIGQVD